MTPLVPAFPDDLHKKSQLRPIVQKKSLFLARWESSSLNSSHEWWQVLQDRFIPIEDLSANTRSKVRRGLRGFHVRLLSRDAIIKHGYPVYSRAFERYETHERCFTEKQFREAVQNKTSRSEFFGAVDKKTGELAAFSENIVDRDRCFYNTIWFSPSALKQYVSYGMFYQMSEYYLKDRGLQYISDGSRNISHKTNIHQLLIDKFGFQKTYCRLNVLYHPFIGIAVKILYPFRVKLSSIEGKTAKKISVLLELERIRRSFIGSEKF